MHIEMDSARNSTSIALDSDDNAHIAFAETVIQPPLE